jgi:biopolymer transport protein TolR
MKTQDTTDGEFEVMCEINMIPFIDVSLVLLIIFMVMTPFLVKSQIKIDLPKAKTSEQTKTSNTMITVQVGKDGSVYFEGKPVQAAAIEGTLKRMLLDPERQPVMIEADKDVPFQFVVAVMDIAKKIGAIKMGVSVKQDVGKR